MIGQTIAHYTITEKIGEGGMGEVYRATDTKLKRDVALKILPESFAKDPQRMARFQREAEVLASLNHPNIAGIHGLEKEGSTHAIAMELVEGETLAARISKGAVPLEEALKIALQIAEALEAAHEKGIIHRDLKPANVIVTPDGTVKVLDFGLAKVHEIGHPHEQSSSPTLTAAGTQIGMVLGTAAYMAPEQARGQLVDARADTWAFGVLLYEMLTGERLFQAEDVSLTMAAVLTAEPDFSRLPAPLPPSIQVFLQRCLERDKSRRVQAIGDVRLALEGAFDIAASEPMIEIGTRKSWLPWLVTGAATLLTVIVMAGPWTASDVSSADRPQRRVTLETPPGTTWPVGAGVNLAFSPDGETVVYAANRDGTTRLYQRSLSEFESSPIPGTEGARGPVFSWDGQWVGFNLQNPTRIVRTRLATGESFTVCTPCDAPAWTEDGSILFMREDGSLHRVSEHGGEPELVLSPRPERGISGMNLPKPLPFGGVYFMLAQYGFGGVGVYSQSRQQLIVVSESGSSPLYSATGHLLFTRDATLHAVPFDAENFEVTGPVTPVLPGVRVELGGAAQVALSRSGSLAFIPGTQTAGRLAWVNREGRVEAIVEEGRIFHSPRISLDGRSIAVEVNAKGGSEIWIHESGTLRPLTNSGSAESPIWTPDGQSVTYGLRVGDAFEIQTRRADGIGETVSLVRNAAHLVPEAWSADGQRLIYRADTPHFDLFVLDRRTGDTQEFIVTNFDEHSAAVSPSGEWVAYVSDQTGSDEVYLRPFDNSGRVRRLSRDGGDAPRWGRDDTQLMFRTPGNGYFYAATIQYAPLSIEIETLFSTRDFWNAKGRAHFDVHPDREQFLMVDQRDVGGAPARVRIIENWSEDLQQKAPK